MTNTDHDPNAVWGVPEPIEFQSQPSAVETGPETPAPAIIERSPESPAADDPASMPWGLGEAPRFSADYTPPALRQTPTAVSVSDTETFEEAIQETLADVYIDAPALEAAAEIELLANAAPELRSPMIAPVIVEPDLPLESTEPLELETSAPVATELPETPEFDGETDYRIGALDRKIARFPDSPTNYVLRGELYLAVGADARARADFERAIHLADALDPALDWGYINSATLDRAHGGLRQLKGG